MALHSLNLERLPGRRIDFDADCLAGRTTIDSWTFTCASIPLPATGVASDTELFPVALSSQPVGICTRTTGGALGLRLALELAREFGQEVLLTLSPALRRHGELFAMSQGPLGRVLRVR